MESPQAFVFLLFHKDGDSLIFLFYRASKRGSVRRAFVSCRLLLQPPQVPEQKLPNYFLRAPQRPWLRRSPWTGALGAWLLLLA